MSASHPAIFMTVRSRYVSSARLAKMREDLDRATGSEFTHQELLAIWQALTAADDLFAAHDDWGAIAAYNHVLALILQYEDPAYSADDLNGASIAIEQTTHAVEKLTRRCASSLRALESRKVQQSDARGAMQPPQPREDLAAYRRLGIRPRIDLAEEVTYLADIAAENVARGDWTAARACYEGALKAIGDDRSAAARAAAAALHLNLGAVCAQAGQTRDARAHLNTAGQFYTLAKDKVGQAQVALNLAAVCARGGQARAAKERLAQASTLLTSAAERPVVTTKRGIALAGEAADGSENPVNDEETRAADASDAPENLVKDEEMRAVAAPAAVTLSARRPVSTPSVRLATLSALVADGAGSVTYRSIGADPGWSVQERQTAAEAMQSRAPRVLRHGLGKQVVELDLEQDSQKVAQALVDKVYAVQAVSDELRVVNPEYTSLERFLTSIPRIRHFDVPMSLGDCYCRLGQEDKALEYYLDAAQYPYLNVSIQAPALWCRIARCYLALGDAVFKAAEDPTMVETATQFYAGVLRLEGMTLVFPGDSPLYGSAPAYARLGIVGDQVRQAYTGWQPGMPHGDVDPSIAEVVHRVRWRWVCINNGLDYYGNAADYIPIWSFAYLQDVARHFAGQAIQAERQYIDFQVQCDAGKLTKVQLQGATQVAVKGMEAAATQTAAAEAELCTYLGAEIAGGGLGQLIWDGASWHVSAPGMSGVLKPRDLLLLCQGEWPTTHLDRAYLYRVDAPPNLLGCRISLLFPKGYDLGQASDLNWVAYRTPATQRRMNAEKNREEYEQMTDKRIVWDAAIAQIGAAGAIQQSASSGLYTFLEPDEQGNVHEAKAKDWWGAWWAGWALSKATMQRGTVVQDYELAAMDRDIEELRTAEDTALTQVVTEMARLQAARAGEAVAAAQSDVAKNVLAAFDAQLFQPDVWAQMAGFMHDLSKSYLHDAVAIARLMERAYQFENDSTFHAISPDYSAVGVPIGEESVLSGDLLLRDIERFTYDMITTAHRKRTPIKHTISLAEEYPYLFQTAFRRLGWMHFDTRLEQFDRAYPGTYGARIEAVEVEFEGLLPRSGIRGSLTNAGLSWYRPLDPDAKLKMRFQPRDTLAISNYRLKSDSPFIPSRPGQLQIFQGAGVASAWTLDIPPAVNDLDYRLITDVRLNFYFTAFYDEDLAWQVKEQTAAPAERNRILLLHWLYPDAFYAFHETGLLEFSVDKNAFPFNEKDHKITSLSLLIQGPKGVDFGAWQVALCVPGKGPVAAIPNQDGLIGSPGPNLPDPWAGLAGVSAYGPYALAFQPAGAAAGSLQPLPPAEVAALKLDQVEGLALVLGCSYTPRTEELP